jgi:hypothetical protein
MQKAFMACWLAAFAAGIGSEIALAQSGGWSNTKPGTRMCRDANGKTFLSEQPCEVHYRCYDDAGKLYTSTSPCPRPREVSPQEAAQKREAAERKRQENHARLRARDPVAWKELEKKVGGDLGKCTVTSTVNSYIAMCPSGQQTQPAR